MTKTRRTQHVAHSESRMAAGFTLVELLVVIGIIAVLIGILMPSLSKARSSAMLTKCSANLNQMAMAAQMHVNAHRGYYPLAGVFYGTPPAQILNSTPEELQDASKTKYSYMTYSGRTTYAGWQTSVAQYLTKHKILDAQNSDEMEADENKVADYMRFFNCPADVGNSNDLEYTFVHCAGDGSTRPGWILKQSYLLNEAVFGIQESRTRLRGKSSSIAETARTFMVTCGPGGNRFSGATATTGSAIRWGVIANAFGYNAPNPLNGNKPITSIALAEALTNPNQTSSGNLAQPVNPFDLKRHRGRVPVLFFDGHVETRQINRGDLADIFLLPPKRGT